MILAIYGRFAFDVRLDRMGNTKQALQLITTELKDVNKAIEFCKEHDDQELWEDLINYSTEKPCMFWYKFLIS